MTRHDPCDRRGRLGLQASGSRRRQERSTSGRLVYWRLQPSRGPYTRPSRAVGIASASSLGPIRHRRCRCADRPCRRATSAIIAMLRCRAPYGLSARRDGAATAARRRSRSPCDPWSAFASMRTRTGHAHGRLEDPHHRLRRRVGLLGPLRCEGVSIGRRLRQAHLERAALGADRPFRPASRIGPARRAGRDRGRTRRRSRSARIG